MLAVLGISTFVLFTSKFGFEKWKMNIFYLLVPSPKRFLSGTVLDVHIIVSIYGSFPICYRILSQKFLVIVKEEYT